MVAKLRLRTKVLILLLLGVVTVTVTTLLIVRQAVDKQIRAEILGDLRNSVNTFKAFQREREATLSHSAELVADLPTVQAMMTTNDVVTIQDASAATWRFSGSDLLALADPTGQVMAVHAKVKEVTREETQAAFANSVGLAARQQWWRLSGHLYEVFFHPIYFHESNDDRIRGVVAL